MRTEYYLCVRESDVVGPHTLDDLREWMALGAIPRDIRVRKGGEEQWTILTDVHKIDFITVDVRTRLERGKARQRASWYSEPATAKQLAKLQYFEMPFDANGLTKGHASELIDCFTKIDPGREEQYQDRPALPEQIARLRTMGESESGLSYAEAKELIAEKEDEERSHLFEDDVPIMILENMLNDADTLEICHYRELNTSQLRQMLDYLDDKHPGWKNISRFDVGKLVPLVFPELAERRPKRTNFSVVILLLVFASTAFVLYQMRQSGPNSPSAPEDAATPAKQVSPITLQSPGPSPALTVQEWEKKAVEEYPALGVAGSPLNVAFVARYKTYKGSDYFNSPDWPMRLARECAATVQAR